MALIHNIDSADVFRSKRQLLKIHIIIIFHSYYSTISVLSCPGTEGIPIQLFEGAIFVVRFNTWFFFRWIVQKRICSQWWATQKTLQLHSWKKFTTKISLQLMLSNFSPFSSRHTYKWDKSDKFYQHCELFD